MDTPVFIKPRPAVSVSGSANNQTIDIRGAYIVDENAEERSEDRSDDEDYQNDSKDIRLPHQIDRVSHLAVDIGGSLIKLCFWSTERNNHDSGGRLNFRKFPTDRIDVCIQFMRQLVDKYQSNDPKDEVKDFYVTATGGGAYKFYDKIREELGAQVQQEDEMECLIIGLDFFISNVPSEVFVYNDPPDPRAFVPNRFVEAGSFNHPYLLVNIGSGVSIIKVSGPREFSRVGGTSLGGGTLWGLLSLLTGARNFDEMLHYAESGDNTAVDMLVGDIYGADYGKVGLKSTTIASSFGKVYRMKRQAEREAEDHGGMGNGHLPDSFEVDPEIMYRTTSKGGAAGHISFKPEDISKSLLYAVSNNIGQLAFLHAEKYECENIYFGGSFIGGHWQTMATLTYAIKFWSKGTKQALFLRHEGYLGAVGAFLRSQPATE